MRRLTEWWNQGDDFATQRSVSQAAAPGAAPDFLAQTEDPDKSRVQLLAERQKGEACAHVYVWQYVEGSQPAEVQFLRRMHSWTACLCGVCWWIAQHGLSPSPLRQEALSTAPGVVQCHDQAGALQALRMQDTQRS